MEDLPEEIVTEILSRLPAESIIRCKVVRKAWYALLTNPNFVSKHLAIQHQSGSNNHMFLMRRISPTDECGTMCILSADNVEDPQTVDLPSTFQLCGFGVVLIGHCDGLIALSNGGDGIIVCNPVTREFKILPDSSLGPIPYVEIDDGTCRLCAFNSFLGFGYDYKINDYKFVRAVTYYWFETGSYEQIHRVEVFCIRTGSCWRELNVILDSSAPAFSQLGRIMESYFDGACYWLAENDETCKSVLMSFQMADEVFVKIPIPTLKCFEDDHDGVTVGVYKNSLALFIYPFEDQERIDIWVMKEIGVKESWSKQLTIKPQSLLAFWNGNDREFLNVDPDGQLAIYDSFTMESKSLSLTGVTYTWIAVPYMKTIVSLNSHYV